MTTIEQIKKAIACDMRKRRSPVGGPDRPVATSCDAEMASLFVPPGLLANEIKLLRSALEPVYSSVVVAALFSGYLSKPLRTYARYIMPQMEQYKPTMFALMQL
jgi:hypothetical protein